MSTKAKFGWILALLVGWLAFMAIVAAQPAWGFHQHYSYPEKHAGHANHEVHYYLIAFACTENKLDCLQLPSDEFPTYDKCFEHLMDIKTSERYRIPSHPLVLGKCISWSPPLDNIPQKRTGDTDVHSSVA